MDLAQAIFQAHFPDSDSKLNAARDRLAFDEIFLMQLGVCSKKDLANFTIPFISVADSWMETWKSSLPFQLTSAQQNH